MKRTAKDKPKIDWSRVDAMSEAERHVVRDAVYYALPLNLRGMNSMRKDTG